MDPENGAGDRKVSGHIEGPRNEGVVDKTGNWAASGGLSVDEISESRRAVGLEVGHKVGEKASVVTGIVGGGPLIEEFKAEKPETDGDEIGVGVGVGGEVGLGDGAGAKIECGGEGDEWAFGGYALGEAEERIDVALPWEGDEEEVEERAGFSHGG